MSKQTGFAVRKLRLAKGLTLAQLADKSGVPLSTLSKLELGQSSLGYDKLLLICRAMDVDPGMAMLAETSTTAAPSARRAVMRAGEGEPGMIGPHAVKFGAADLLSKPFMPAVAEIHARTLGEHGPLRALTGEAYLYVLENNLVLHTEIYAPLKLRAGDSIYFDARLPHALLADGEKPAKTLLILAGEESGTE